MGSPPHTGLVASGELGLEQVVEPLDLSTPRQSAGLPFDVLRPAIGLGGSRQIAERFRVRRRVGEFEAARRGERDAGGARENREGARLADARGLVRPARSLEESRRPRQVAPQLGAPRERERARPRPPKILSRRPATKPKDLPCPPSAPPEADARPLHHGDHMTNEIFSERPLGC